MVTGRLPNIADTCTGLFVMQHRWPRSALVFAAIGLTCAGALAAWAQEQSERHAQAPQPQKPPPGQKPAAAPPQGAPKEPQQQATINVQSGAGWISRCASESRQSAVECSVEQTVLLTNTGQLLASVVVRVPADTHQPVMMIQVPIGLYLPAGLSLQIDENKAQPLALQTCDLKGCYAGTPIPPEMIASMKGGKLLTVTFQNLAKDNIRVPLTLDNFAGAYQKIQ